MAFKIPFVLGKDLSIGIVGCVRVACVSTSVPATGADASSYRVVRAQLQHDRRGDEEAADQG